MYIKMKRYSNDIQNISNHVTVLSYRTNRCRGLQYYIDVYADVKLMQTWRLVFHCCLVIFLVTIF